MFYYSEAVSDFTLLASQQQRKKTSSSAVSAPRAQPRGARCKHGRWTQSIQIRFSIF